MNETKLEIYPNKHKAYKQSLTKLNKANTSPKNKELILKFHNYLFSAGSKELRVAKLISQLRRVCEWFEKLKISKNLDQLDRQDIITIVSHINRWDRRESTRADYRRCIKQFYRWFREEDKRVYNTKRNERLIARKFYNHLDKEVSISYSKQQIDPSTVIRDEDIESVIEKGARTPRDKAFLACLHEWGTRAGEFLRLKIGDIVFKESYAEVNIPGGKTGRRTIYGVKSTPYLLRYLDTHVNKDCPDSYLWLSQAQHNKDKPLLHKGAQKIVDRCFERAKINKKHNLHWFRHSRASLLASKLTEQVLCRVMGWRIGSAQVRTYSHLCNQQIEDAFLEINGLRKQAEDKQEPIKCSCGTLNTHKERYCYKCFRPLSVSVALQDEELVKSETNKTVQFLMEIMQNPELLAKFKKFQDEKEKAKGLRREVKE